MKTWFLHPYPNRVTARERISSCYNNDTNKSILDKMPAIMGYTLGHLAGDECKMDLDCVKRYLNRNKRHYSNAWFVPKDDDWD